MIGQGFEDLVAIDQRRGQHGIKIVGDDAGFALLAHIGASRLVSVTG